MSDVLWHDRRRRFGLPLSFTKYHLTDKSLTCQTGILSLKEEEVLLYRIMDVELSRPFGQRIFGTGTIIVHSSDKTAPELCLTAVKNPRQVKNQISDYVEQARNARRMRTTELLDGDDLENLGE